MRDTAFWATADGLQVWDPPDGQWSRPPALGDGAGLVFTADDLLASARMLLRGGGLVLSADAVTEMTRDQLTPDQKARDGRGFVDGRSCVFHQSVVINGPRADAFGWTVASVRPASSTGRVSSL